ncbi:27628_t:CDS:2 [Dentiscutata erythropus]|uniref:27628_t:CDS:1 n=1 Tax=Dentiscutata erythropus TaxID=1348616 RepID=A0A9N9DZR8_9GLOM|nr:27628_t:CDS:2 [Dentiscutata erythropus]
MSMRFCCLAPIAKVLINDNFGIVEGLMTTVQQPKKLLMILLAKIGEMEEDLVCNNNTINLVIIAQLNSNTFVAHIIPSYTGAAQAVGLAFRVPVSDVGVVDLTVRLKKEATYEEIKIIMKRPSENEYKGILGYTEDEVVSSDFIDDAHSSVFDVKAGIQLNLTFIKIIAWYDNEFKDI